MSDTIQKLKRLAERRDELTEILLSRDDVQEIDDEAVNRQLQAIEDEAFRLIEDLDEAAAGKGEK